MNGYPNGPYGGGPQWQAPPPPGWQQPPAPKKNSALVPLITVLAVILVVALGFVAWLVFSRDGQTQPAAADPVPAAESVIDTTVHVPQNTTYVETVTETQVQQNSGSSNSGSSSGGYGAGLQVRERCWNGTSASAIFRGDGTAKCNFIALVGNRLSGSSASGYRSLTVTSPNTGEAIRLSCQQVQDSNLTQLWRCDTHHGSRLYVYP